MSENQFSFEHLIHRIKKIYEIKSVDNENTISFEIRKILERKFNIPEEENGNLWNQFSQKLNLKRSIEVISCKAHMSPSYKLMYNYKRTDYENETLITKYVVIIASLIDPFFTVYHALDIFVNYKATNKKIVNFIDVVTTDEISDSIKATFQQYFKHYIFLAPSFLFQKVDLNLQLLDFSKSAMESLKNYTTLYDYLMEPNTIFNTRILIE